MLTSIRGPASIRLKEIPRNLIWCGAVVFGNYAKTTGRTRRVVTVVMVVVPVARATLRMPPVRAVERSVTVAAARTMDQENYADRVLVKCCTAKSQT
ncbi:MULTISPECIES: hypothetical protein [Stenotrophomonas]|uniref:hypothetical protein n=1 Tax=Stenotrophomonas sp. CFBP8994 TaxID=3096527 RepID=UPI002A6A7A41|nr:hypothetical protein [Stenotrophomonas sp. CFBP8994]MDY0981068.1 hypothetical protein [Stenotrophomonas sp. CFBP8994]